MSSDRCPIQLSARGNVYPFWFQTSKRSKLSSCTLYISSWYLVPTHNNKKNPSKYNLILKSDFWKKKMGEKWLSHVCVINVYEIKNLFVLLSIYRQDLFYSPYLLRKINFDRQSYINPLFYISWNTPNGVNDRCNHNSSSRNKTPQTHFGFLINISFFWSFWRMYSEFNNYL